ncbi:SNF2-related protein [Cyclobacterium sp. SYSU L10401]|uniref:SNF2-related protein n=1 Tax=Cyclobacterium sp. SYSU L10401 TaxID=2678657 RepID=UPI0013D162B4|nr:SNF2-related protein [Cyclobacterium sp. SYSU L10401]
MVNAVTGYFSPSGLARFQEHFDEFVDEYNLLIGDLVTTESTKEKVYQLLSDNLSIKNGVNSLKDSDLAIKFLQQDKVKIKTLKPNFCHAKAYLFQEASNDPQKNFHIVGSSNMTEAGMGLKYSSNIELNTADFGGSSDYKEMQDWFNSLWDHSYAKDHIIVDDKKVLFKDYLIGLIKDYHKKYTPEQIYYKVLFELFKNDFLKFDQDPEFRAQIGSLENTAVFKTLYPFQQKGVLSLIKMLRNYNGAILADAVGLGKTWQALAVMKFFQMRNHEVILLCPKKLHQNWTKYQRKKMSRFEVDKLDYTIRWHTDLQDDRLEKKDDGLKIEDYFQSDGSKLLVIDESHNLRNDSSARYQFLMEEIIKKNIDIKVLLLSATPINTKLADIKNQFKLFVKGKNNGFKESLSVPSLDALFRESDREFISWVNNPDENIDHLISRLGDSFIRLTDTMVVSRTRDLIKIDGLDFPKNNGAVNKYCSPKNIGDINSFESLEEALPDVLAGYKPSIYAIPSTFRVSAIEDARIQDSFLVKMMYILMIKRFESSWKSFQITLERILAHHQNALDVSLNYKATKIKTDALVRLDGDLGITEEEMEEEEEFTLGKREIRLQDIDAQGNLEYFIEDLESDVNKLKLLKENLKRLEDEIQDETGDQSKDNKLKELIKIIREKQKAQRNGGNKKLIVFTTFKDTAMYLFDELKKRGFQQLAVVTGGKSFVSGEEIPYGEFEPILERFAPFTKLYMEREWPEFYKNEAVSDWENFLAWKDYIKSHKPSVDEEIQNPIDILITTDCLSEGQNLQDADLVVNYDIHWNPVRIVQRFGRIDRIGSPNMQDGISAVNFWPTDDINTYLNLQHRVEVRVAAMKLAGSEVPKGFNERIGEKASSEMTKEFQKAKMLRQMAEKIEEIEGDDVKNFSFADLSMENFRQELFQLLQSKKKELEAIPNGVFTGFKANPDLFHQAIPEGMVALMGYPAKPSGVVDHQYKELHLMYLDNEKQVVFKNPKEILAVLQSQKLSKRQLPKGLDAGDELVLKHYSKSLLHWLDIQAGREIENTMDDIFAGDITFTKSSSNDEEEQAFLDEKYQAENFDLICWIAVQNN